jgi:ribosomal protein S18 acetylase RimI-like enzyme
VTYVDGRALLAADGRAGPAVGGVLDRIPACGALVAGRLNGVDAAVEKYRRRVREALPTSMLSVSEDGVRVGWCQWYRWSDYPEDARAVDAEEQEMGIDYAIGEPSAVGRGLGTAMIAALVAEVRNHHAGAGVLVNVDATNVASRHVLEKNGFLLVTVRPVVTEPTNAPMAIYRLAAEPPSSEPPGWSPQRIRGPAHPPVS